MITSDLAARLDVATRAALYRHEIACQQEVVCRNDDRAHARAVESTRA